MGAEPADRNRNRGGASARPGDLWSGGGRGYEKWMRGGRLRHRPRLLPRLARTMGALWRGRRGGPLTFVAAALAAVLLAVPLAWAGRTDPCAAAEVALIDDALRRSGGFESMHRRVAAWTWPDGGLFSRGRVGRQIASEEHPVLPAFAGCTALFWRARAAAASVDRITPVSVVYFVLLR